MKFFKRPRESHEKHITVGRNILLSQVFHATCDVLEIAFSAVYHQITQQIFHPG